LKKNQADCPVCKSAIPQENLIPIYNKDQNNNNTNRFNIPNRPKGERTEKANEVTNNNNNYNRRITKLALEDSIL